MMEKPASWRSTPVSGYVAAVSAGVVDDVPMLDLCYEEDSAAMVDLNCVMDDQGRLIEIQGTGEGRPFTLDEQQQLVELCQGHPGASGRSSGTGLEHRGEGWPLFETIMLVCLGSWPSTFINPCVPRTAKGKSLQLRSWW